MLMFFKCILLVIGFNGYQIFLVRFSFGIDFKNNYDKAHCVYFIF